MPSATRDKVRNTLYFCIGLMIIYGPDTAAQAQVSPNELDFNFWFKAALSSLLGIILYIARGTEVRLKNVEADVKALDKIAAERRGTLQQYGGDILFLKNEARANAQTVAMLEKLILSNYHDKQETDQHRARVEEQLREIRHRVDGMTRNRRQDDERGHEHDT